MVKNAMDSAEITEEIMTAEIISEEMTVVTADVAETAEETADVVITVAVTVCRQFRHRQWQSRNHSVRKQKIIINPKKRKITAIIMRSRKNGCPN